MKKVIGGLLVAALLSRPSLLRIDMIAYEVYKSQQKIILVLKQVINRENIGPEQIESALADIGNNTREISELLKEKNKITARLETTMDLMAYTRSSLDGEQMAMFRDFHSGLNEESPRIQEALRKIDERKDLTMATQEILHTDANYDFIYDELSAICYYQDDVKMSLNGIIENGQKALDAITFKMVA